MWKSFASITQLGQAASRSSLATMHPRPLTSQIRPFHQTTPSRTTTSDKEKDLDRETLNPERSEVTKSGTDSEVASHPSAYDPTTTSPESEIKATEEESKQEGKTSNPLDMSPANKGVSAENAQTEGGRDGRIQKTTPSGRGQSPKHKKVNPTIGKK